MTRHFCWWKVLFATMFLFFNLNHSFGVERGVVDRGCSLSPGSPVKPYKYSYRVSTSIKNDWDFCGKQCEELAEPAFAMLGVSCFCGPWEELQRLGEVSTCGKPLGRGPWTIHNTPVPCPGNAEQNCGETAPEDKRFNRAHTFQFTKIPERCKVVMTDKGCSAYTHSLHKYRVSTTSYNDHEFCATQCWIKGKDAFGVMNDDCICGELEELQDTDPDPHFWQKSCEGGDTPMGYSYPYDCPNDFSQNCGEWLLGPSPIHTTNRIHIFQFTLRCR